MSESKKIKIFNWLGKNKDKLDKKDYEEGYKKYESKAKDYMDDTEKTKKLVEEAIEKSKKNKNALGEAWGKLQLLFDLVNSWRKGEYTEIPKGSIIMIIATIIYFVSPVDLIPDFIVALGLFDDAAVIAFTFKQLGNDLEKFKIWQESNIDDIDGPEEPLTV